MEVDIVIFSEDSYDPSISPFTPQAQVWVVGQTDFGERSGAGADSRPDHMGRRDISQIPFDEAVSGPGQLVDVGGYSMHLNCLGQGSPTVILGAGLDDFSMIWSQVQPDIAKFTRVCSYDRAGFGWSEPSPYPRTSGMMVKELHTLLVNAHVEGPYVMVGHSFGGALMKLYVHHYPAEVVGLVLVDAMPDELFTRVPVWREAFDKKLALFRMLAPLSSFGLLALVPDTIPNHGMPEETLAQYRAVAVSTSYFQTDVAEHEILVSNLEEVRAAHIDPEDLPLIVVSDGIWNPFLGLADFSDAEIEQARQAWQEMQSELPTLSTDGKQVIAEQSGHYIQFDQPDLVIGAIQDLVETTRNFQQ